jgi:thiazole tautomerase (transcriptional regulator TenI)
VTAIPIVHVITNDDILNRPDFIQAAHEIMVALGPRGALHLRAHETVSRRLYDTACALLESERRTTCWLVVNDRVDVACAAGVGAVQLTSRSMSVADARRIRADLRIGASVHSADEALNAEQAGAEWYVIGPAFETETHPGRSAGGAQLVAAAAARTRIPAIAIGGVTPERVLQLRNAGAHGVAAIRGVWQSENVAKAAHRYLLAYDADDRARRHDKPQSERERA